MGILRVGFKDLIRNKRKALVTILGVLFSIILISGINISTLSLTIYNIKTSLSDVYVDINVKAESVDVNGILETLNKVKDYDPVIEYIIPSYSRSFFTELLITSNDTIDWDKIIKDNYDISYFQYRVSIMGVNNSFYSLNRFKSTYELISGRLPLNPKEILLDYDTFSSLNLNINDTITLGTYILERYGSPEDRTFTISDLKVTGTVKINPVVNEYGRLVLSRFFPSLIDGGVILTSFEFALKLHENLSSPNDIYTRLKNHIRYNFLINHYSLDVFNYEGIIERIYRIENRIYIEDDSDYFFEINSDLLRRLEDTRLDMAFYQNFLLMISFSVFFLSFFLSMTLYTISLNKQEIKFGQFASKGASKRQIIIWIIFQTTIYGIVGGLIGVLGGYFTSYFILFSLLGNEYIPLLQETGILINPFTIIFSVVIGVTFSLISLIKPLKDFSKKSIITTTKKFSQIKVEEKPFKSKLDWVLLIFGILPLIFTFLLTPEVNPQLPWEIQIFLQIIMQIMIGWTVVTPFLLSYCLIKIIGWRFSNKFFRLSRKLIKPFAKNSYEIIARNLTRNIRRTIALIFMISFTFCFAILSTVVSESQKDFEYEITYLNIGSDIKAFGHSRAYFPELDKNITDMSLYINNVTPFLEIEGVYDEKIYTEYGWYFQGIKLCAIKPENYFMVSHFKDKYFSLESNENSILELNNIKNGTLIHKDFALEYGLNLSDTIKFEFSQGRPPNYEISITMEFKIIGFFQALPGMGYYNSRYNILVNYEYINEIYDLKKLLQYAGIDICYLIDVKDDANKTKITQDIEENFNDYISSTQVLEEVLASPQSGYGYIPIIKLLDTDYFFIMVIGTFGLIILLYENFSDRKVELGILRAKGIEKKELIKINLIEGIIHITYGFLLGCLGFLGAFLILRLLDGFYFMKISLRHSYIIPLSMLWQMGIAILIMIISVWITSIIEVKKTDIPKLSKLLKI